MSYHVLTSIVLFQPPFNFNYRYFLPDLGEKLCIWFRHALSTNNVPGPDYPILVAGQPVSAFMFAFGHIHSLVFMFSYLATFT